MSAFKVLASQIADLVGGSLVGDDREVIGVAPLDTATPSHLSFLSNQRYQKMLSTSDAGVVIVSQNQTDNVRHSAIVVKDPYLAFAKATHLFDWRPSVSPLISSAALVDTTATISPSAQVCAGVVIEAGVSVGERAYIGPNTVIGRGSSVGSDTRVEANVTLYSNVSVGVRCLIHSGAVLGADGFGFAHNGEDWVKIVQLGGVVIGNDVEIGAGTTIDRGALNDTIVADGVKLDNQIQIAHNVEIGKSTAIAGCTAIAGSTRIGSHCTIAGMSGVTGHLDIADRTHITAMSLVSRSIKEAGAYSSGTGIEPHAQWKRNVVRFRQLDTLSQRVRHLEECVKTLSEEGKE